MIAGIFNARFSSINFLRCFPAPTSISPHDRTDVDIEVSEVVAHISTAPGTPSVELVGKVIRFFTARATCAVQYSFLAVICLGFLPKSPLAAAVMAARQVVVHVTFGVSVPRIRRFLLPFSSFFPRHPSKRTAVLS